MPGEPESSGSERERNVQDAGSSTLPRADRDGRAPASLEAGDSDAEMVKRLAG